MSPHARLAPSLVLAAGLLACRHAAPSRAPGARGSARAPVRPVATRVSAGRYETCAIRGGEVDCWGPGGFDGVWRISLTPARVGTFAHATRVSVGSSSACVVDDGAVWCWGTNTFGELGDGTKTTRPAPVRVRGLPHGVDTVAVACSEACAVARGALYCWGALDGPAPKRVATPAPVTAIANTCSAVCVVAGGDVLCRGTPTTFRTPSGEIEDASGGLDAHLKPLRARAPVESLGGGARVEVVAGGTLEVWEPLAVRTEACQKLPAGSIPCAPTLRDVTTASSSEKETCAIVRGVVQCFTDDRAAPWTIPLPAPATQITSGSDHHCALAEGEVYCWGTRAYAALGDGTPLCVPASCWDSSKADVDGGSCEPPPGCRRKFARPVQWPD